MSAGTTAVDEALAMSSGVCGFRGKRGVMMGLVEIAENWEGHSEF